MLFRAGDMNKTRILVVDDEPFVTRLVSVMLEKTQMYEVRTENRPFYALAAAREFRPRIVMLDVDMPGKDGGQIASEMQRDPELSKIPVLFLTALISRQDAEKRQGGKGSPRFLAKPVDPMTLLEGIEDTLREAGA